MFTYRLRPWQGAALVLTALVSSCAGSCCVPGGTLPIYQLAPPVVSGTIARQIGRSLLGTSGTVYELPDEYCVRAGDMRVEVYKASGGIWAEDSTRLWNPDLAPTLRDTTELASGVSRFLSGGRLFLESHTRRADSTWKRFEPRGFGASYVKSRDRSTHAESVRQLDVQMNIGARVAGSRPLRGGSGLPTIGGGGEFKAVFGDGGRLIGFNGVWRPIQGVVQRARVIPLEQAKARYIASMAPLRLHSVEAHIAYYSAPAPEAQTYLYPVYVFRAKRVFGRDTVFVRDVAVPATEFRLLHATNSGVAFAGTDSDPPARTTANTPRHGSTTAEGPEEGGSGPSAGESDQWREVGIEWQGKDAGGLTDAQKNAEGFLDALVADGWANNFNWGDDDAWYSDWIGDRKNWVDAADIVFYSGHAEADGWDTWSTEDNAPRGVSLMDESLPPDLTHDLWGGGDLEWLVIAACGPLQDEQVTHGDDSAIDRWEGAFGGLHLLLGYATESNDTPNEGKYFAKYALQGKTLINAWFRATTEAQEAVTDPDAIDASKVWAGAMWAYKKAGSSPFNDHLWGHGSVAPDSKGADAPDKFRIIWTQM